MTVADQAMMKVKLVRSASGRVKNHKACVQGLGLRRIHQVVEVEDTPATRGMANMGTYMVLLLE